MWGSDDSHVWAVGDSGTILQWDGSSWGTQTSGTIEYLTSVWGSDATHLWAVSTNGTILKGNGSSWSAAARPSLSGNGTWIGDGSHIWLAGGRSGLAMWNGTDWKPSTSRLDVPLYAVWASQDRVVAVGADQSILEFRR